MTRRSVVAFLLLLFVFVSRAEAQTTVEFLLTPSIGDGITPETSFRPKYVETLPRLFTAKYGWENAFLVALELTPAQKSAVAAQPDVVLFPKPLDEPISSLALSNLVTRLEAAHIPATWITTANTWRDVLRGVHKAIRFMQRHQELFPERLFDTVTLDTRLNQMTTQQRQRLSNVADDLGLDRSQVTTTTTIRQLLIMLGQQLPDTAAGGEAF
jgi:hypothetical protein